MTADTVRLELERTLREPSPNVELAAWLLSLAPAESMEAIELRRLLSQSPRREANG